VPSTARQRAALLVLTLALALAGLAAGLTLRDSGAQTSAVPAGATGSGAAASAGADDAAAEQTDLTRSQAETTPAPGVPTEGVPADTAQDPPPARIPGLTTALPPLPVTGKGVGSAQLESVATRRAEQLLSCAARPPATGPLLSLGGITSARPRRPPVRPLVVLAIVGGALAFTGYLVRRRGHAKTDGRSTLEVAGSAVAILGTVGALAASYFGAGVKDHPPPSVSLTVREVHARITHGAYEDKVVPAGRRTLSAVDRLEIGNVVWVELHTVGYKGDDALRLQWAMFHAGPGEPFIRYTTKSEAIDLDEDAADQTQFLPIWVGTPRVRRFRAEFRVLDAGRVRQIASTGPMRGIGYRYAC
jgi:hypothetical protein